MHIKKLEISGFKSFVDKTVVHFDNDVIGIVGPNGCGKSNIVDAIRWCMGEQSAKHLRGRSMEDIIFNGSETRPQHGMAEVTLTFDNSDGAAELPELYRDYSELAITRRLFRDGTSEYLLNKTPVRLRDITDLFLGTGVGTKAYSIVEQGRVGQIVSSRPQDRRAYIEEAAGITKYRLRRKQAERKMDQTRQNLLRLSDIVSEVERSRDGLKRQAAKAERFLRYRSELEDLFLHDAAHRLLGMIVTGKLHRGEMGELSRGLTETLGQLQAREGGLQGAREGALQVERQYDSVSALAQTAAQHSAELRGTAERTQDRVAHLTERLAALGTEHGELGTKRELLHLQYTEVAQEAARLEAAHADGGQRRSDDDDSRLARAQKQARAAQRELQGLRDRLSAVSSGTGAVQGQMGALGARSQDADAERARLAIELEALEQTLEQADAELAAVQLERTAAASSQASEEQALAEVEQSLNAERAQIAEVETERKTLQQQLDRKRARLSVLADLHKRLEGVSAGTRALLQAADPAVVGLLAERLDVPERYTRALAGLLGDTLQCVIVSDPERGLQLLGQLRDNATGRATIAARSAYPQPVPPHSDSTLADQDEVALEGVVARLVDVVGCADEDRTLVSALIGDAAVVETAGEAYRLNQEHVNLTVVAVDGTVVRGAGLVSGGSSDNPAATVVEQKREMATLEAQIAELEPELAALASAVDARREHVQGLEQSAAQRRKAVMSAGLAGSGLDRELARLHSAREREAARGHKLHSQLEALRARHSECEREQAQAHQTWLELLREEVKLCAAQSVLSASATLFDARLAEETAQVMAVRLREQQVREQLESQRRTVERAQLALTEADARLQRLDRERHEVAEALGAAAAQWMQLREQLLLAKSKTQQHGEERDAVRARLDALRGELANHEEHLQSLRANQQELDEQLRAKELLLQKLDLEREHLLGNVAERFRGLNLNSVVGDYHLRPPPDGEHRRRIDELTKLIDRMGPVNLDAKTEFEEAETRFAELSTQKQDIEEALSELERAIRHMDRESKRRFKESFDAINDLFKQTFVRLFKGGRGELKLTDPENILETGVDIVAQPPGKKLGNIELMSGGEKALTATALIFAIFQHRPSPFCILDEVDAPLDEANVGRYNDAIRSMTSQSQFIIITHIKKTMQAVDVLYGVTMGEPGVSRLVSVKINDEAKARSTRSPAASDLPAVHLGSAAAPAQGVA